MILGRITAELQFKVPDNVRDALALRPGDVVAFEIEGDRVVMTRSDIRLDEDGLPDMFIGNVSTFTEWAEEADSAYDVLATR